MRLIDADLLKEHISSYAGMFTDEGFMVRLEAVLCGIDFQPTAYDVEAVVRELEEQRDAGIDEWMEFCFIKAIEIVRGGRNG